MVRGSQTVRASPVASATSAASSAASIAWRVGATPQSTRRSPPASRCSGTGSVPPGGSVPRWLSGSPSISTSTAKVRCVWLTRASMLRSVSRVPVSSASEPCSDTSQTRQRGSRPLSRLLPGSCGCCCCVASRGSARASACTAAPGVFTTTPATGAQPELICTKISRCRSSCQSRCARCSSASPSQKRSSVDAPGCSTRAPGGGSPSPPPPPPVLDGLDAKLAEASASPEAEAEIEPEPEVTLEVVVLKLLEASRRGTGGSISSATQ